MNAVIESRRWTHPDTGRALAILGAAAGPAARITSTAIYLLFLGGGITVWQIARIPQKGALAIVLLGAIGAAVIWALWFSRVAAVQIAGRSLRMPRIDANTGWALALAFVLTVLLPAALAGWAGVDPRIAYGGVIAGALAGALLMLLPGMVVVGAMTVAGWSVMVVAVLPIEWERITSLQVDADLFYRLPWLAAGLAVAAVWSWGVALGERAGSKTGMGRSTVRGLAAGAESPEHHSAHIELPDWVWPAGQIEPQGPARPVRAMGAWLGTPFASLSRSQLLIQLGAAGLIVVLIVACQLRDDALGLPIMTVLLATGVVMTVLQSGVRLDTVRRQRSAQWSELALLPGWGNAAMARVTLLRAVAAPTTAMAGGLLVLLLGLVAWRGGGFVGALLVTLAMCAVWLASLVTCLRPLAGKRLGSLWMIALCLTGIGVPMLTMFAGLSSERLQMNGLGWFAFGSAGCLAVAFLSISGVASWRQFQAQPHPFVEPRSSQTTSLPWFLEWSGLVKLLIALGFGAGIIIGVMLASSG